MRKRKPWIVIFIVASIAVIVVSLFMIVYEIITPEAYSQTIETIRELESIEREIPDDLSEEEMERLERTEKPIEIIIVEPEQSFSKALFGWIGANLIGIISLMLTIIKGRKKNVQEVNA